MYDLIVIGNPLLRPSNPQSGPAGSLQPTGPPVNSSVAAAKLGVDSLALIGKTDARFREDTVAGLDVMGLPEYYFPEPNGSCSVEVTLEVDGEFLPHIVCLDMIRIKDIPREFLTASRIILNPSFQEVNVELATWLKSSSHGSIIWDPGIQRVNGNGEAKMGLSSEQMREMLELVEIAKLNQQESQFLTAQDDPRVAAELLVEWGARIGIITLGTQGCVAYDGNEFISIPAYHVEPITTYGAGDVFVAGLATRMIRERDLLESTAYGSAVASLFVQQGDLGCLSNSKELDRRTDALVEQARVQ